MLPPNERGSGPVEHEDRCRKESVFTIHTAVVLQLALKLTLTDLTLIDTMVY